MKRYRDNDDEGIVLADSYLEQHTDEFKVGIEHILKVDPSLKGIIEHSLFTMFAKTNVVEGSMKLYFDKLCSSIIAQQISGIAAKNIRGRIVDMFGNDGKFPSYQRLHKTFKDPVEKQALKDCGLSQRKLSYIESLVEYFYKEESSIEELFKNGDDEHIIEELVTHIKGIGPWSAKMFLITALRRMDIFAPEDLGIARGCSKYLEERPDILVKLQSKRTRIRKSKIKHKSFKWKIHDEDIIDLCGDLFMPYRTLFMFILWRMSDTNMDVVIKNEKDFVSR